MVTPELRVRSTRTARVEESGPGVWRLSLPAQPRRGYLLAQLDDCSGRPRDRFPWRPPLLLSLHARVSRADIPGTWGFGLWNDPFSAGMGLGGTSRRLPVLPAAAWFFHASPPNFLSLADDLPAQGFLAATFAAVPVPSALLALGLPVLPLLAVPAAARRLRRFAGRFVRQDAWRLEVGVTEWHRYDLEWGTNEVRFHVDGQELGRSGVVPRGPLGLVLWIDNQYAAFPPSGRLRFGSLACPTSSWLELSAIAVEHRA